jgi:hypothetical protein
MAAGSSYLTISERFKIPSEQWDEWQLLCKLRVAAPGIVQSFNATKQTVTVQLAIRENVVQNAVVTPIAIDILQDIPIFMPRAGGFLLTLPVKQGDECLVIFADNCFDAWWQSGGIQNQVDRRRHDLSDGFAIIGPWSQPRVVSNYPTNSAQLRSEDGNTMVEVQSGGIVNIKCAYANVNATTQANVTAPTIDLNGNVNISGNLGLTGTLSVGSTATFSGITTIQGKAFLIHEHTGVQTGGGTSGPVA